MKKAVPLEPFFADFADGRHADLVRVSVRPDEEDGRQVLVITLPDGMVAAIWPLDDLRALRDQANEGGLVVGQGPGHLARLYLPEGAAERALRANARALYRRERRPGMLRRLGLLSLGAVASLALIVFVLVPLMANQLARFLPPEGERALGEVTYQQIRRALGSGKGDSVAECTNPAGIAALERMTERLAAHAVFDHPLTVRVLRHSMVNAFALPGGHVILFEGLLKEAGSAEAVAGVLAHEMGHVATRDPTRNALRSAGTLGILALVIGDFAGGTVFVLFTNHIINASYSRAAETAADAYATRMLTDAGLPTAPFAEFFLKLAPKDEKPSGYAAHLMTHPEPRLRAERALAADRLGDGEFVPVLTDEEWQALLAICAR